MKTVRQFLKVILFLALLLTIPAINAQNTTESRILMPTIGVDAPIVPLQIKTFSYGTTWDTASLYKQVGYLTGTSWFGTAGNIVLGGHSELARGQADVFYSLDKIQIDDPISVMIDGQELHYRVSSVDAVSPNDVSVLGQTSFEQLTIITCDLQSYDNGDYAQRMVVRAVRT